MGEVHNFACCYDNNFKAAKINNIVFLVIEGIMFISSLIGLLALRVRIKKSVFILILVFSIMSIQDCYGFDCIGYALGAILAIANAICMIVDALLLAGSIKRNKIALIFGLVLSGIVILGLIILSAVITIINLRDDVTLYQGVLVFTLPTIGLRLWTFLISVGTLQEVMLIQN